MEEGIETIQRWYCRSFSNSDLAEQWLEHLAENYHIVQIRGFAATVDTVHICVEVWS